MIFFSRYGETVEFIFSITWGLMVTQCLNIIEVIKGSKDMFLAAIYCYCRASNMDKKD